MKKNIFMAFILFQGVNAFACCGCAIVNISLAVVTATFNSSMATYDTTNTLNYEATIIKSIDNDLISVYKRLSELKANIGINTLLTTTETDCKNEIERLNNLNSISKTQEIIYEFEKKQENK